ncbi:MAG: saccharopine dehydrogenase NADP-binding domain-containing protein [Solirubrobacterales bacterium]
MTDRELSVVVLGATGVTGRRVAGYLAERAREDGFAWAAAARDPAKLERVMAGVGAGGCPAIAADTGDERSLRALAARTRAVVNLVGPYTRHARPVVEACIGNGTHYLDLTGEIPFVRTVIRDFDAAARAAGVAVVQVCGFEALPPDLAVLAATEAARRSWDEDLVAVDLEARVKPPPGLPRPTDGVSGGTSQSMVAVTADPDSAVAADPAALVDDAARAARVREASPIDTGVRRGAGGSVIAPMAPAAFINPAVIQRTAELAGAGEPPPPFRYREGVALDGGIASLPARLAVAGTLAATQAGMRRTLLAGPATRQRVSSVLGRVLPKSGFGPSPERLEGWRWSMRVTAATSGEHRVEVEVDADGHPGYLTTARILGEAGLILSERAPASGSFGCLTPAIALGTASMARFERAGLRFSMR